MWHLLHRLPKRKRALKHVKITGVWVSNKHTSDCSKLVGAGRGRVGFATSLLQFVTTSAVFALDFAETGNNALVLRISARNCKKLTLQLKKGPLVLLDIALNNY